MKQWLRKGVALIWVILQDSHGGIGDAVMEVAILGAGAQSIFGSMRTGISGFGTTVGSQFSSATVP